MSAWNGLYQLTYNCFQFNIGAARTRYWYACFCLWQDDNCNGISSDCLLVCLPHHKNNIKTAGLITCLKILHLPGAPKHMKRFESLIIFDSTKICHLLFLVINVLYIETL